MTQKEKSLYIKKDEVLDVIDRYIANEVARRKRKISEGKCSDWMKERSQNEIDGAEFLKAFLVGYLRGEDDTVYPERREQTETIDNFTKVYKEKRGVTYVYSYSYEGVGIDANSIYAEFETKFSIARGVIQDKKFTRYIDNQGNTYTSYIRR